jgi:alpha-glucosidase
MLAAVVFQMTWQGAPTLDYGDEAGLLGWTDPDNRRPYPWGREDAALMELHREAIRLRRAHPALRAGSTEFLFNGRDIISYARWDGEERFAVAINAGAEPRVLALPVWKMGCADGAMESVLRTEGGRALTAPERLEIRRGMVEVSLPAHGSVVLKSI